ncbi:MAG: hypothetical protein ACRDUV_07820 [Pseudonocardiaceae bacterium]
MLVGLAGVLIALALPFVPVLATGSDGDGLVLATDAGAARLLLNGRLVSTTPVTGTARDCGTRVAAEPAATVITIGTVGDVRTINLGRRTGAHIDLGVVGVLAGWATTWVCRAGDLARPRVRPVAGPDPRNPSLMGLATPVGAAAAADTPTTRHVLTQLVGHAGLRRPPVARVSHPICSL